jgi:hypothetical protein
MAQTPTQYQVAEDVLPSCRRALIICAGLSGLLDLKPIRVLPLAEFRRQWMQRPTATNLECVVIEP